MLTTQISREEATIKLAIVSPQPIIIRGLERICQEDQRLTILRELPTLSGLKEMLSTARPDVTLIDWDLISHGSEAVETIRAACRLSQCLLFMHMPGPHDCRIALELGARGTIAKSSPGHTFRRAIWKVHKRGIWIDPSATEAVIEYALAPSNPLEQYRRRIDRLTRREREVVTLVCRGYRNKKIASDLNISETTVCHHLTSIFGKLEVDDRMGLMVFAHQNSLQMSLNGGALASGREQVPGAYAPLSQTEAIEGY